MKKSNIFILDFFKKTRSACLAALLFVFYGLLSRTWSIRHEKYPKVSSPCIYAHWHGDELLLIGALAWKKMAVMVSRSLDGEMLQLLLHWFGFYIVRGSSSRGGVGGLKGLIDAVGREGLNASLAVDGPRGPIYRVKSGILKLAQSTGRPLVPGASAANVRFVFKRAWNRCYLPFPFARAVIVYGEPLFVPRDLSEVELEVYRLRLEKELVRIKSEAEASFNRSFVLTTVSIGTS